MNLNLCKGKVIVVGRGSSPLIKMKPSIQVPREAKVLITSPGISDQDVVSPTVTLTDKAVLYVFGPGWATVNLSGRILLGDSTTAKESIGALQEYFEKNRVSKKGKPVRISMGSSGVNGFLTGMHMGGIDPNFHFQDFSLTLQHRKSK